MAITMTDLLVFSDRTIDGFVRAINRLDDTQITARPAALPRTNTPFALVTHSFGAMDWWAGHIILGEPSDRDRDGEFTATGTCAEAVEACTAARARLHAWAPRIEATPTLANPPTTQMPLDGDWTVGTALIHIYEELAQHLGHLEMTVDLLTAER
jgi:hypothetical protein